MFTSYFVSNYFIFVLLLALQLFIGSVSSLNLTNAYLHHKCLVKEGKYQPRSEFEKNLNYAIEYVSGMLTNKDDFTYGDNPNKVNILIQCRGDTYNSKCRSCYATAVAGLRRRCQRNKAAKIWYDQCFLHISQDGSGGTFQKIDYENTFSMQNLNNVSGDTKSFNIKTMDFLQKLMYTANKPAPAGQLVVYHAAGEERIGANKMYAMVQCINIVEDCKLCLNSAIKELFKCCGGKQGARVYLGMSCNLRCVMSFEQLPSLVETSNGTSFKSCSEKQGSYAEEIVTCYRVTHISNYVVSLTNWIGIWWPLESPLWRN